MPIPQLFSITTLCVISTAVSLASVSHEKPNTSVERVRSAALSIQRKSWEQGVLAVAFLEEGKGDLAIQMAKASLIYRSKDGVPAALDGAPVDPLMLGEALAFAAKASPDPELQNALESTKRFTLRTAPRAGDGTIYHVDRTFWSDSFHTTPPFLASVGEYDEALRQIEGQWKRLWDSKACLLAHIWDDDAGNFQDGKFWGGGHGWAAAALTRVIRALPKERQTDRALLSDHLQRLIDGCLAHQTPSGLFHDIIDDPNSFEETNLAQMLAYSIYESVHGGWLDRKYLAAADRMRTAANTKVDDNGFIHGACGAPDFQHSGISAEAQAFYLMMEAAATKVQSLPR